MKLRLVLIPLFAATIAQSQPLRVMTYNIRYDNPGDGINKWSNRIEKVTALIHKYNPDVIGIQEALHHQILDIIRELPQYAHIGVGRDDGKDKGEFSAILYRRDRLSVMSEQTSWLSEHPDVAGSKSWDAAITRVVTWAKFKDNTTGESFYHINTHFDHIGKEARKKSASIILRLTDDVLSKEELAVVVTGDFNCEPSEEPYRILVGSKKLLDARPVNSQSGTFCTFQVTDQPCKLIDHIFYSAKFWPSNYKVINDNDGVWYPSDHLPVMVELNAGQ